MTEAHVVDLMEALRRSVADAAGDDAVAECETANVGSVRTRPDRRRRDRLPYTHARGRTLDRASD